jgi:hypothetical protein
MDYTGTSGQLENVDRSELIPITPRDERIISQGEAFIIAVGHGRINHLPPANPNLNITPSTLIVASITEVDANNVPFIGLADTKVYNVAAFNGGANIKVDIVWGSNIRYKIMLRW